MRVLISWVAWEHDFNENGRHIEVSETSPNLTLHKEIYEKQQYCKHVLLTTTSPDVPCLRTLKLYDSIKNSYPKHEIEIIHTDIKDVTDNFEIEQKVRNIVEKLLSDNYTLDIFFSAGTSVMRTIWFLLHFEYHKSTRIIQSVSPKYNKGKSFFKVVSLANFYADVSDTFCHKEDKIQILPSVQAVYESALKIAHYPQLVTLIQGETGVGKEELARYIHQHSKYKNNKFVAINCSSLSDELFISELFGHKKGSFTGAYQDKEGFVKMAENGTLFLDEIGDISPKIQLFLLRFIQERTYYKVGDTKEYKSSVKIIVATHKPLRKLCEEGLFRWDLYYRLTETELYLPSFIDYSTEDKIKMIHFILKRVGESLNRAILDIEPDALRLLCNFNFKGNIRELENLSKKLYVFSEKVIKIRDLQHFIGSEDDLTINNVVKSHIEKIYINNNKNQTQTAKVLGISRSTLIKKLKEYNILSDVTD